VKSNEKILITTLFPFDPNLHCEIFIVDLLPSCEHLSLPHNAGIIEHIIVAQGTIEVLLNNNWQVLHAGDAICFNADQHHGYRNTSSAIARFHNIIHYPVSINSNQKIS
jgi:quercetin dioxygenase-like cupin family protein